MSQDQNLPFPDAIGALIIISGCHFRPGDGNNPPSFWIITHKETGRTTNVSGRQDFEEWRREIVRIANGEGRAGVGMITPKFTRKGIVLDDET